jgi:imidazolonepropionase-like amidohydrolase
VRNLGTPNNNDIHIRNLIETEYFRGPRVLTSGVGISITGGHGWQVNEECDTPEEALKAGSKQIRLKTDVIKMFATGGMGTKGSIPNAPQLSEEQMRVVCEEAERVGVITAAYCTGLEGTKKCHSCRCSFY